MIPTDASNPMVQVLVVDDEPDNLLFFRRTLRQFCSVVEANNGIEALEIAKKNPIAVVVTDQKMPKMTGIELLGELQQYCPDVPKIVVTAYNDLSPVIMAINTCVLFGYLIKPVKPDDLRTIVQRGIQEYTRNKALRDKLDELQQENQNLRSGNEKLAEVTNRLQETKEELETNIDALEHAYQRMADIAHRDELTQVYNRRQFSQTLFFELNRCKRYHRQATLLLLDVDEFKKINDRHGHPIGDAVLKNIARTLETNVRANDQIFRIGGDEFAVILPETDQTAAKSVVGKLKEKAIVTIPGIPEHKVTFSIGIQEFLPEFTASDEWYALADAELYREKERFS